MRLFVFFADKLLQWGHRVEQEAGYRQLEPAQPEVSQRSAERLRRDREPDGPPEHWARLVRSVPPEHWLELFRRAEAEPFSELDSSGEGEVAESVAFNETDDREPIKTNAREDRLSDERSVLETSRNRTDYSAAREHRREFPNLASPALSPDGFLNRLHFLAQPPPADRPVSDYVHDPKTEDPKTQNDVGSRISSVTNSDESVSNPSKFHDDQSHPPESSRSKGLDFAAAVVHTQPAANAFPAVDPPINRTNADHRASAADLGENSGRDSLAIIPNNPSSKHSRPAYSEKEQTVRGNSEPGRYVSRLVDEPGSSRNSSSDYRRSESDRQPTAVSYLRRSDGPTPSRRASPPDVSSNLSAARSDVRVKFSESVLPPPPSTRARFSDSLEQGSNSQASDTKTVNDSNEECWPALPASAGFDLDDDLFAREVEADELRRLDQEQRGTLWSE
jgi:hypothetical protein